MQEKFFWNGISLTLNLIIFLRNFFSIFAIKLTSSQLDSGGVHKRYEKLQNAMASNAVQ